ncbi:Dabb family protein [Marinomonas arenicola]|uniref:Dabb family protein n=1 Tax=Marinomonas arenicola TaxID=569601 RepID=UPI00311F737C
MIRHILFIQFKEEASAEAITGCLENILALKDKIEGIEAVEWGVNNSPVGSKHYTHCVFMTFVDEAARDAYLPHSAHQTLVNDELLPILEDVVMLDYAA